METASDANCTPNPNHDALRRSSPLFCQWPLSGPNVNGFSPTQKNTTRLDSNGRPPSDGQLPTEHAGLNHPLVIPEPPSRHSCPPPIVIPAKAGIQRGQEEGLPHRRQHGVDAARRPAALAHSSPSFPRKRESRGVGKRGYPMAASTASTRPGAPARSHTHHRLSGESGNPEGSGRGATPSLPAQPPRGPARSHTHHRLSRESGNPEG